MKRAFAALAAAASSPGAAAFKRCAAACCDSALSTAVNPVALTTMSGFAASMACAPAPASIKSQASEPRALMAMDPPEKQNVHGLEFSTGAVALTSYAFSSPQFPLAAERAGLLKPAVHRFFPSRFRGYVHTNTHDHDSAISSQKKFCTWVFKAP